MILYCNSSEIDFLDPLGILRYSAREGFIVTT